MPQSPEFDELLPKTPLYGTSTRPPGWPDGNFQGEPDQQESTPRPDWLHRSFASAARDKEHYSVAELLRQLNAVVVQQMREKRPEIAMDVANLAGEVERAFDLVTKRRTP